MSRVSWLIVGLRERGLDVTRPILAVLDGSTALRRAVLDELDRAVIGRWQLHKIRNVEDRAGGAGQPPGRRVSPVVMAGGAGPVVGLIG